MKFPLLFCSFLFFTLALSAEQPQKKPNVIIILTDDQGWGDFSFNGNPYLKTPAIDRLAHDGASFSNFYVSPLCAPTRASILTGRYHLRTGTLSVSKGLEIMNDKETTLGELFASNGYKTGLFGKWHNGSHYPNDPNGQGFEEFFGFCAGHWSNYFNTVYQHNQSFEKAEGYITDVLTNKAIEFVGKQRNQPFFCYLSINAPHTPHQVPDKYFNKYKEKGLSDEVAAIYGMCENTDDNVGRLLGKLKELDLEKNTIVMFMTDNGPNGIRYNGIMRGIKGSAYEGGVKVPLFVRWQGKINAETKIDNLSQHIDIFPTLVDLCQLQNTSKFPIDGKSRSELLLGGKALEERNIYSHVAQPVIEKINPYSGSVRNSTYSLVLKDSSIELFDLKKDPAQKTDIAKTFPDQTAKMKKEYLTWFDDCTKDFNPVRIVPLDGESIILPGVESEFTGELKYKEGHGWAHDWIVNFGRGADTVSWNVSNPAKAKFMVYVNYASTETGDGIKLQLIAGKGTSLSAVINGKCDPPYIKSPDRVVRKEAYEREWCRKEIGEVLLPAGEFKISVVTKKVNGVTAEFDGITLERIK